MSAPVIARAIVALQDALEYLASKTSIPTKKETSDDAPRRHSDPAEEATASTAKKRPGIGEKGKRYNSDFVGGVTRLLKKKAVKDAPKKTPKRSKSEGTAADKPKREVNPNLAALRDWEKKAGADWEAAKKERLKAIHAEWAKEKARRRAERAREQKEPKNPKAGKKASKTDRREKKPRAKRGVEVKEDKPKEKKVVAEKGEKILSKNGKGSEEKDIKQQGPEDENKEAVVEKVSEIAEGDKTVVKEEDSKPSKDVTVQNRQIGNNDRTYLDGMQHPSVVAAWNNGKSGSGSNAGSTLKPSAANKKSSKTQDLPVPEDRTEMHRGLGNMERTWVEGMQEPEVAQKWMSEEKRAQDPSLTIDPASQQDRQLGV